MNIQEKIFNFVDTRQALELQQHFAAKVRSRNDPSFHPRLICGLDAAYSQNTSFSAAVVYDLEKRMFVESVGLTGKVSVDYIPGFLGFREGPILMRLVKNLESQPDVYLIDGHGRCHPRRFGVACHIGLALGKPTIGVAKSYLYGKIVNHKVEGPDREEIGQIIVGSSGKKFFVSVGHRISLGSAVKIVRNTLQDGHPAPLRRAHLDSIKLKKAQIQ